MPPLHSTTHRGSSCRCRLLEDERRGQPFAQHAWGTSGWKLHTSHTSSLFCITFVGHGCMCAHAGRPCHIWGHGVLCYRGLPVAYSGLTVITCVPSPPASSSASSSTFPFTVAVMIRAHDYRYSGNGVMVDDSGVARCGQATRESDV